MLVMGHTKKYKPTLFLSYKQTKRRKRPTLTKVKLSCSKKRPRMYRGYRCLFLSHITVQGRHFQLQGEIIQLHSPNNVEIYSKVRKRAKILHVFIFIPLTEDQSYHSVYV